MERREKPIANSDDIICSMEGQQNSNSDDAMCDICDTEVVQKSEQGVHNIPEEMQKLDLLGMLDKARVQYYHWITVVVAGCGFYTDAYDLFCLSTVTNLLGRLYFYNSSSSDPSRPGKMPLHWVAVFNSVALCGGLVGSLFFGFLGDKIGRKRTYSLTLVFMLLGSIGSGLAYSANVETLMWILCFFRFWLGFGIGGDFPASAAMMAEYANVKSRGALLSALFAMQGCGVLAGAGVIIFVTEGFRLMFPCEGKSEASCIAPSFDTPKQAEYVWRIILLVGAIPVLLTLYFRTKLPESPRYTVLVEGDVKKATENMNKLFHMRLSPSTSKWRTGGRGGLFTKGFASKFGLRLVAVSLCYFMVDVCFYSQVQFQKDVLSDVGWVPPAKRIDGLREAAQISEAMAMLALLAALPGYWVTVCTVEWLGRRAVQLQGFFFLTILYLVIGFTFYNQRGDYCGTEWQSRWCNHHPMVFIALYGAMFFFSNFGGNTTIFILPAELFPTRLRSTCVGISTSVGKLGALCGSLGFIVIKQGLQHLHTGNDDDDIAVNVRGLQVGYVVLACCCIIGFLITFFLIPETARQSLEALTFEEAVKNSSFEPSADCHQTISATDNLEHV